MLAAAGGENRRFLAIITRPNSPSPRIPQKAKSLMQGCPDSSGIFKRAPFLRGLAWALSSNARGLEPRLFRSRRPEKLRDSHRVPIYSERTLL